MPEQKDNEVLIPEVLPPARGDARGRAAWREVPRQDEPPPRRGLLDGVANFLGPVLSGLILDFVHMKPMKGFMLIWPAILGFWFARVCNLRLKHCVWVAALSVIYSSMFAKGIFLPVAAVAGMFFAVRNSRKSGGSRR